MAFMEPEIHNSTYWEIETNGGTWFLPADVVGERGHKIGKRYVKPALLALFVDYVEATEIQSVTLREGILGRLSAPGYMDCTDWTPYDSESDAMADLTEDCDDSGDDAE